MFNISQYTPSAFVAKRAGPEIIKSTILIDSKKDKVHIGTVMIEYPDVKKMSTK